MQRRATVLWAALFIVLSVGAYAMIGVAQEPSLVENPDRALSDGSSVQFDGRSYTVTVGDGSGELTYFNESARATESFENGSQMDYRNATYDVVIPNATDPNSFALRENQSLPENVTTTTVNETEYVVVEEDGNRTLVETEQYIRERFGPPQTESVPEGDQIEYQGNTSTVANVSTESVVLAWDAPQNESIELSEGATVTLGGTDYVAHFPDTSTLALASDVEGYQDRVALQNSFRERVNGLWAVVIIGGLAAVLLFALAYMPSRY